MIDCVYTGASLMLISIPSTTSASGIPAPRTPPAAGAERIPGVETFFAVPLH